MKFEFLHLAFCASASFPAFPCLASLSAAMLIHPQNSALRLLWTLAFPGKKALCLVHSQAALTSSSFPLKLQSYPDCSGWTKAGILALPSVLVRGSIAAKRRHDQGNSTKGQHLIGSGLHFRGLVHHCHSRKHGGTQADTVLERSWDIYILIPKAAELNAIPVLAWASETSKAEPTVTQKKPLVLQEVPRLLIVPFPMS